MKRIFANRVRKLRFIFINALIVSSCAFLSCAHPVNKAPVTDTHRTMHAFENLGRAAALKLAQARRDSILSLLTPPPDPYFGRRESGPTCDATKRPAMVNQTSITDFQIELQLYASENRVYGLCNQSLDQLKSRVSWRYCSERKILFEIKEFFAATEPWKNAATDDCRSL